MKHLGMIVIALALPLAACSSEWRSIQERAEQSNKTVPQNHKAEILAFMRTYLNDPTGVRGAMLSVPELRSIDGVSRYMSCVRYDAKKSGSRYAGPKDSMVLFRDGRFDRFIDNARARCTDVAFQPFPELEQLTR